MSQKNRKYTVYEIEKLTKGKLSKYKLTKAIKEGQLKAQEVKEKKRGRGIPNFFIFEDDLNEFLKKIESERKHFIYVPEDTVEPNNKIDFDDKDQQQIQDNLDKIEKKLDKLNEENAVIIPLLEKQTQLLAENELKSEERKELITELLNMPSFMVKKRKDVLNKLSSLS